MIHLSTLLLHYKRLEIQQEIVENAKDREVAIKFGDKGFGKRPDVLNYPQDVLEFARQGATSFHSSEEHWSNPLNLDPSMKKEDMENLRTGWDLILDIDCHDLNYSKIAADLTIKALKYNDVKSISCKFSGNKGFHIGVPWEAFPDRIGEHETKFLFPEAARKIAFYIKEMIKRPLGEQILKFEGGDFGRILEKTGMQASQIQYFKEDSLGTQVPYLNSEPFLDIDTILISSRHLCRMVYSFNEKSGMISVPVDPAKVLDFKKEDATHPVKISPFRFLDTRNVEKDEAKKLLTQALDFMAKKSSDADSEDAKRIKANVNLKVYEDPQTAIPEQFFPTCIQTGLKGLKDGRKRFLFVLLNFLSNVGWEYDQMEKFILEWNKRNQEPLRDTYILGHLRYHKARKQKLLPPNCDNKNYYSFCPDCPEDPLHRGIKNPVQYAKKKARLANQIAEQGKKKPRKKKEEEDYDDGTTYTKQ